MNIIELKKVNKTLARRNILHDVSFSVKKGDIYGFL